MHKPFTKLCGPAVMSISQYRWSKSRRNCFLISELREAQETLAAQSGHHRKGLSILFRLHQYFVVMACFVTTFCVNTELAEQNG